MRRATISATDLRVRLGEMLRRLEREDLVIEKGGIPVAVLTRYEPEGQASGRTETAMSAEYEASLVKRADARGWETTLEAIREGWGIGLDADAAMREMSDARAANARLARYRSVDAEDGEGAMEEDHDGDWTAAPPRLRRLHRPATGSKRVADGGDEAYRAGGAGDDPRHLR